MQGGGWRWESKRTMGWGRGIYVGRGEGSERVSQGEEKRRCCVGCRPLPTTSSHTFSPLRHFPTPSSSCPFPAPGRLPPIVRSSLGPLVASGVALARLHSLYPSRIEAEQKSKSPQSAPTTLFPPAPRVITSAGARPSPLPSRTRAIRAGGYAGLRVLCLTSPTRGLYD